MNYAAVKQLAELFSSSNLSSFTYGDSEFNLSLSKEVTASAVTPPLAYAPVYSEAAMAPERTDLITVTAPVVGTVYRSREPRQAPLVSLGDTVQEGDALCVVEAMKIFSDITAPCAGTVVEILLQDGKLAEYGAKLIVLELGAIAPEAPR
jgi:acetyl-CoA carboxylase biotin carboxyl carrier protein